MNQRFVVVDIETTGNSPKKNDKIIQIAAVVVENDEICERFSSFVNPKRNIPEFIKNLTGIHDGMIAKAPYFSEIAEKFSAFLEGGYFVAHNVPFDMSFILEELRNNGCNEIIYPSIDTVELARIIEPTIDNYQLSYLAEYFSLNHANPHQADSDAEVTAQIFIKLMQKLQSLPLVTLQKLASFVPYLKSDLHEIIDTMIQTKLDNYLEDDKHFDIFRNIALKNQKSSLNQQKQNGFSLKFREVFKEDVLTTSFSDYEVREGQLEMMNFVDHALYTNQHALIEAGTGTGKTLGYLIPALFFAINNRKPVVISTYTIQLQQQLFERDIPIVQNLVPFSFHVVLLKGRSHYICLRKFEQSLYEHDENYDSVLAKAQILVWLTQTSSGDVDEINLPSGGKLLWDSIKSDERSTIGDECPWQSRCFYDRVHKSAGEADLIITNHALLFSDLINNKHVLPEYDQVILDEAHHVEKIASQRLGVRLNYFYLRFLFSRIGTFSSSGLLTNVVKVLETIGIEKDESFFSVNLLLAELQTEIDELFRMIRSYVLGKDKQFNTSVSRTIYQYDIKNEKGTQWAAIVELTMRINFNFKDLILLLTEQQNQFSPLLKYLSSFQQGRVADYFGLIEVFEEVRNKLTSLLLTDSNGIVHWIEVDTKGARNAAYLYSQPTDVSSLLADLFFAKKQSVILTSATLSINQSFDFFKKRLGLEDFQPLNLAVPDPFNYEKQVKVMIPTDLPEITTVSLDEFVHAVVIQIANIAEITKGRMLVLFTSYEMLQATYTMLKEIFTIDEFVIIGQGISSGSRSKLTKNFKQFSNSILLATSSFWEGIDIPGDDLSCVVMVRLPFLPPAEPVFAAKSEQIKNNGGDPFTELALPQAIIQFKQGFGRLIRGKADKGVVFILDRRIVSKNYGNKFLLALPPVQINEEPLACLLKKLNQWL